MPAVIKDDPEVYVIYVMRDPRDTICSRHGKDKSMYYSNIRLWRQMHSYARQMTGQERFLEIRYEDLLTDPVDHIRQIAAFIDHPIDEDKLLASCRQIDQSRLDNSVYARPYRDQIPGLAANPLMEQLGYNYQLAG